MSDALVVDAGETAEAGHEVALDMLKDPKTRPHGITVLQRHGRRGRLSGSP